jgi:hypothetical protein
MDAFSDGQPSVKEANSTVSFRSILQTNSWGFLDNQPILIGTPMPLIDVNQALGFRNLTKKDILDLSRIPNSLIC